MTLETCGVVTLWLVAFLRVPQVIRHREQRALWAAVGLLALLATLYVGVVQDELGDLFGAYWVYLGTHLVSVVTAGVTLHFILIATDRQQPVLWLYGLTGLTVVVLLATYLVVSPANSHPGSGDLPLGYMLLVSLFSVVALGLCALVCTLASRYAGHWSLGWGLRGLAAGWVLSAVPWLMNLAWLLTGDHSWITYFSLIDGLSMFCLAAGTVLPLIPAIGVHLRELQTYRQLHPLWQALTKDVPDVVLRTGASHPVPVLLGASATRAVDRHLIEIRDAMRDLRCYVSAADLEIVGDHVRRAGFEPAEAHVMAGWLHTAQEAKRRGIEAQPHTIDISGAGGERDDEIRFLLAVARAYCQPHIRDKPREVAP